MNSIIQGEVEHWHKGIFSGRRPIATVLKILEEAAELYCATKVLEAGGDDASWLDVMEECADVAIACYALAVQGEFDLEAVMRKKLAVLADPARRQRERDKQRGIE